MNNDIRWIQRFNNFNSAFLLLQLALKDKPLDTLSDLEQEGIIQRFEYTYELAWKTMKDYMEDNGIILDEITPRAVIKSAFAAKIIKNAQVWIDMMIHRNILSHTYDMKIFKTVLIAVYTLYFPAINELHDWLSNKVSEI